MIREMSDLARSVQKVRIFGAAALDLAYVAVGRLDGFIEYGLQSWDIAAGTLLIEEAGGQVQATRSARIPGMCGRRMGSCGSSFPVVFSTICVEIPGFSSDSLTSHFGSGCTVVSDPPCLQMIKQIRSSYACQVC